MKKDKELVKLAAKAAGYKTLTEWSEKIADYESLHYGYPALHKLGAQCVSFNPLIDDGDALRLAVDLGLDVLTRWDNDVVVLMPNGHEVREPQGKDKHAATRLAITRAAADIGEGME